MNLDKQLKGRGVEKIIIPSNIIDIYTRLEVLVGLKLSEMMTINENKKLSRNRERRIDRRNKINDDMKLFLSKIKSEKKKKIKNFDKIKHLEILLVRIKYAHNRNKLKVL